MNLFIFYFKTPPILSKDSANLVENKMNLFIFYLKTPPILFKHSAKKPQQYHGWCNYSL